MMEETVSLYSLMLPRYYVFHVDESFDMDHGQDKILLSVFEITNCFHVVHYAVSYIRAMKRR